LHNYQPTATDGRCGNSTIPYQFINFGPPETCRFTGLRDGAGQPLIKREAAT